MDNLTAAAVALGRKGGKAGKGASKRRGDSAYYRWLRAQVKRANDIDNLAVDVRLHTKPPKP